VPSWGSLVAAAASIVPALAAGVAASAHAAEATHDTRPAAGAVHAAPAQEEPGQNPGQDPGQDAAREIWLRDCAVCHATDGRGTDRGPDLAETGTAALDYVLRTGRMPIDDPDDAVERGPAAYDTDTIDALVAYAAGLDGGLVGAGPEIPHVDVAAGDVAAGGEIWRGQCAACHRWSGDGGALSGDIAPDVRPATSRELGDAVRSGPFAMPRFGQAALSDQDLNDLAAFVADEIDRPDDRGGWAIGHIGPVAEGAIGMVVGLGGLVLVTRALGTRERPGHHRHRPGQQAEEGT
jgi:ubiquinol-cytochrome c reductase cytochrome c subunit